jgi:hypothetical protein
MALVPIGHGYEVRWNTATLQYHAVQVNGDGTITDLGAITSPSSLVDTGGVAVDPATSTLQTAANALLTTIDSDTDAIKTATEATQAALTWGTSDGLGRDSSTWTLQTIDYAHHEVHSGSAFWAFVNASLTNGQVMSLALATPDTTKWSHSTISVDATSSATFAITEGTNAPSGGTAFTPRNFNRNSATASGNAALTGYTGSTPITATGGTAIWAEVVGSRGIHTSRQNASEMILKQNTNYLFELTNGSTANNCTILLTWYEHTDKS